MSSGDETCLDIVTGAKGSADQESRAAARLPRDQAVRLGRLGTGWIERRHRRVGRRESAGLW